MAFTRNRPTAVELLQNSQSLILTNFNDSDTSFGVDHYQFSDTTGNNGKHKDIHIVKRAGDAPNVSNQFTLYSKDYTPDYPGAATDQQFFGRSGSGGISQFTGNRTSDEGWCWCGGILIQWGRVDKTLNGSGVVTFQETLGVRPGCIPFPNNVFSITATITFDGSVSDSTRNFIYIRRNGSEPQKVSFRWVQLADSSAVNGFFWMAIGN